MEQNYFTRQKIFCLRWIIIPLQFIEIQIDTCNISFLWAKSKIKKRKQIPTAIKVAPFYPLPMEIQTNVYYTLFRIWNDFVWKKVISTSKKIISYFKRVLEMHEREQVSYEVKQKWGNTSKVCDFKDDWVQLNSAIR